MRARAIHRALPGLVLAAIAVTICGAPSAEAAFGPIQLISKSPLEQAGVAREPAISADGRYVAFCAELGGEEGVFREQLDTGQIAPVAVGPIDFARCTSAPPFFPNASAPSISADGRFVSFDTHGALVSGDTDEADDVYVADMASTPPTYRLASAVNGGEEPLPGGSLSASRSAITADGNRVAFVNAGNVYVRELSTETTTLISARREPSGAMTSEPVFGGGAYEPAGAAISADGSTVAWVGEHLPEQVPLLGDEEATIKGIEASASSEDSTLDHQYHEPLWRRVTIGGGDGEPTRRIVGGGDPLASGCGPGGTLEEAACQGPFPQAASSRKLPEIRESNGVGWGVKLPRLDGDGDEVAVVGDPDEQYDLFDVDMEAGLDRDQAVRRVTHWTNPVASKVSTGASEEQILEGGATGEYLPFTGKITDCAISADGTRVAFTTTRQHFSTAPFALITEMPSAVSLLPELYVLNLEGDTIERVTPGSGQDVSQALPGSQAVLSREGAIAPSFGGDRLLAFASSADNVVIGDGNEASDVFTAESPPPTPVGHSSISSRPPQASIPAGWRMTANAYSRPDGEVRIVARVPAAGALRAAARAQVGPRLKSSRVAAARGRSRAASVVSLELKLGKARRHLARKPGLVTWIDLTFTGKGGDPLHADLQGRFVVHPKKSRKHPKRAIR